MPVGWLKFLKEIFPDDPRSIMALQEWFGYLLLGDTTQ
jgi:putative DNA primase/helicase